MSESEQTILIVDDEQDICDILSFDFENAGFKTYTARNGLDALKIIQEKEISAVVSDIKMPQMTGTELLKSIKSMGLEIVVVFITAHYDLSDEDALDSGADGIFHKPFDRRQLIQGVANLLTPSQKRWQTPVSHFKIDVELKIQLSNYQEATQAHKISLARGGLFIALEKRDFSIGQTIKFEITFDSDPRITLTGIGTIRWIRKSGKAPFLPGIGIEFVQLENDSLKFVSTEIDKKHPYAYIPKY